MGEKKKLKVGKRGIKNISAVLSQMFAMAMAAILLVLAMRYIVLHEYYGTYMISPGERAEDFQDTQTFQMVFESEIMELSHYLALCSQLETDGEYNPDREVDIFRYKNRKEKTNMSHKEYPRLTYRVGDLVEWFRYGVFCGEYEMSYDDAKEYLTEEQMREQYDPSWEEEEQGEFFYAVTVVEEEFKPRNVDSIYNLELPEGVMLSDVFSAIQQAAIDLNTNYEEYILKKERFSSESNFKYMYVAPTGEIAYTNLENKEQLSVEELKKAFTGCKTYLIYDYGKNELHSNNLLVDHVTYYKSYFRNYSYCFPSGGVVYAAVQTKSSGAFGPYNSEDFYAVTNENLKTMTAPWEQIVGAAVLLGVLSLIALIVFIILQPRKKREELTYFDRWFTEIALTVAAVMACAGIGFGALAVSAFVDRSIFPGMAPQQRVQGYVISLFVAFTFLYVMFLLFMGSLVRRIKAKALWKGSLCYYLLHNTKKIFGKILLLIRKVIEELVNHKLFFVRTFGPYLMFLFMNVSLILVFKYPGIFLVGVFDVLVAVYIYFENKAREEIVDGITRICDGDVEYQIDTKLFFGENKVMAEAVNKIGEAVKTAVQISMKDERLKADLITNVSHDIKTPLTSIINYVDLLKRENIQGDKAREYIRILDEKSQRLKQLTLDLVEASKISSGNITLEMNDLDVKELIKQTLGEYVDRLEEKNLTIVEKYPEQQAMVHADSRHMWRIFENLFLNIGKYAMEGTRVYVDVAVTDDAKGGTFVSGDGTDLPAHTEMVEIVLKNISAQPLNIPAEELTERFIRGDVSRSTEGSGLGLSIAQNLTSAQGGEFKIHLDGDLFKVILQFPRK